jgi:ATP-dependent Clp protease ATP-binding subunit ClpB
VGYDEGGYLTESSKAQTILRFAFRRNRKGSSDVFNILLQILDDGRSHDGHGRTVDFKNTVIIMTSNVWQFVDSG